MSNSVAPALNIQRFTRDVGELLSSAHAQEKRANRQYLLKVIQNVRFLARFSTMWGWTVISCSCCISKVRMIQQYLKKKTDKYSSPQI